MYARKTASASANTALYSRESQRIDGDASTTRAPATSTHQKKLMAVDATDV